LAILTSMFCKAQDFNKCTIYQFSGVDSTVKHIALIQTFNQVTGQIVTETYSNYKKSSDQGNTDGTYYYYYTDSLLTKRFFIAADNDTMKILYFYDVNKRCIREEYFNCERRLRKDVEKGLGKQGGCIVFEEDLEKNRTWIKTNEVTYLYNKNGLLIKKNDRQDYDRVWKYDNLKRIVQERAYSFDKLEFIQDYKYFNGGYKYSQIFYDRNGNPEKPNYSDIIFNPIFTSTFFFDYKGKIIKEEMSTEKGIKISDETSYYDHNGRIVKTIHRYLDKHYKSTNEVSETTHIFEYK
jgi:hypothetical protein